MLTTDYLYATLCSPFRPHESPYHGSSVIGDMGEASTTWHAHFTKKKGTRSIFE